MQRLIKLVLASSLLVCGITTAQEKLKDIGEWVAHYYEKPSPDRITKWITDASAAGVFEKSSASLPMMIFVAEVLKKHPEKAEQWCEDLSTLPSSTKLFIAWSYRNADIPAQHQCIQSRLGLSAEDKIEALKAARHDPLSKEPSSPADLDMLWAVFMATGSEAAVNRIIDVLGRPSPEHGKPGSVEILRLKGAAKWSLSSNIYQHKRVAEIAKARSAIESGNLKKELDDAIQSALKQTRG